MVLLVKHVGGHAGGIDSAIHSLVLRQYRQAERVREGEFAHLLIDLAEDG